MAAFLLIIADLSYGVVVFVLGLGHWADGRRFVGPLLALAGTAWFATQVAFFMGWRGSGFGSLLMGSCVIASFAGLAGGAWLRIRDEGRTPIVHILLATLTFIAIVSSLFEQLNWRFVGSDETTGAVVGIFISALLGLTVIWKRLRNK